MSSFALAVAKKRIAIFVLWPLGPIFGTAAWLCASHGRWVVAATFLLLVVYMGWLASNPYLRAELPPYEPGDVDHVETRELASIMVHVYYALVIAAIAAAVSLDLRFYWVILIAVATWILAQIVGALILALI